MVKEEGIESLIFIIVQTPFFGFPLRFIFNTTSDIYDIINILVSYLTILCGM